MHIESKKIELFASVVVYYDNTAVAESISEVETRYYQPTCRRRALRCC
tara:strand:- start:642 stop:785 length:144 start_codon:yes stop_codon:yes gene_type:complete